MGKSTISMVIFNSYVWFRVSLHLHQERQLKMGPPLRPVFAAPNGDLLDVPWPGRCGNWKSSEVTLW